MEKVHQVHKRTDMDNDGRTVIHWLNFIDIHAFGDASIVETAAALYALCDTIRFIGNKS